MMLSQKKQSKSRKPRLLLKADILSIGTELIMGELVDTNSNYLAAQLPPLGIELQRISQVGDDIAMLVEALQQAAQRSDLILTTGGLGPTDDDLTREAIAQLLGESLYVDPDSLEHLRGIFRQRGGSMPNANIKQAYLVPAARTVPNAMGTAPGWWVEKDDKIIVAMPGPPRELIPMWETQVLPKLRQRAPGTVIVTRSFKTHGLGESALNEMIAHLFHHPEAALGMYAQAQGVQIRVRVRAANNEEAQRMLAPVEDEIRRILGDYIWGVDDQAVEEQIGKELVDRGLTLAVMESCTGGLLAHTITQVPGSSAYFKGGLVAYSAEMKIAWGVDPALIHAHGVVSPQVAQDMARAAKDGLGADLGNRHHRRSWPGGVGKESRRHGAYRPVLRRRHSPHQPPLSSTACSGQAKGHHGCLDRTMGLAEGESPLKLLARLSFAYTVR